MRAFSQGERFVSGLGARQLRPAFVFVGDEALFPKRFRDAILQHLLPRDIRGDVRRMEMQDKERYQRIRETMGQYCGIVELARVEEGEAVRWIAEFCASRSVPVKIDPDGARELVDALGGDMMMISNELEKLMLYVGAKNRITLGDVETMVLGAKQRSLYELTDAISAKERVRSLEVLDAILSSADGEEPATCQISMLPKTSLPILPILHPTV